MGLRRFHKLKADIEAESRPQRKARLQKELEEDLAAEKKQKLASKQRLEEDLALVQAQLDELDSIL